MGRQQLVMNLDVCRDCPECVVTCSYPYHPSNCGIAALRERAEYELTCRRCDERPCIDACPVEALSKLDEGRLVRHTMRCVGCQSCIHACPFGTLAMGALTFKDPQCDLCADRVAGPPPCVSTCPYGALKFEEVPAAAFNPPPPGPPGPVARPLERVRLYQIEAPRFVVQTQRFVKTEAEPAAKR